MDASQHCTQSLTVEIPAVHDDCPNLLRIRNVVERICIEQHQICELSSFNRSYISFSTQITRGIQSSGLYCLHRIEASADQKPQLIMQSKSRENRGIGAI